MQWIFYIILCLFLLLAFYIRFAPSDADKWHVMPAVLEDKAYPGGVLRSISGNKDTLSALHEVILSGPRTSHLAGSVSAGMVTYVSRTAVIGFPDYTTVQHKNGKITLYGRLRFGRRDFGVNAARINGWLEALDASRG